MQICPVGALTATPYRFAARPWDLDQVESTCTTCSVGCRVAVQSSSNRLTRLLGIDIDPVNHGWLCDKGRFAARRGQPRGPRSTAPMVRKDGALVAGPGTRPSRPWPRACGPPRRTAPTRVGVIGGARLTNEGAYAWARVAKGVLGTDSVDAQLGDGLPAELVLGLPRATIDEAAAAPTVVLLTGDLREELPVLFLRLRAAAVDGDAVAGRAVAPGHALTALAAVSLRYGPRRRPGAGRRPGGATGGSPPGAAPVDADALAEARRLLGEGAGVVVVVGRPSLAEDGELVADAARRWPRPCPRRGSCRRCVGATCSAPSTWAWPRGPAGPGHPRRRPGLVRPRRGARCPAAGPRHRRHPGRRRRRPGRGRAGVRRWCCSAPTR